MFTDSTSASSVVRRLKLRDLHVLLTIAVREPYRCC